MRQTFLNENDFADFLWIAGRQKQSIAVLEGKRPTYKEAQDFHLGELQKIGWSVKTHGPRGPLKIPHATSPDGKYRLWFKTQAVHASESDSGNHDFDRARSEFVDIRAMHPSGWDQIRKSAKDR